jgi:hypothetical protein
VCDGAAGEAGLHGVASSGRPGGPFQHPKVHRRSLAFEFSAQRPKLMKLGGELFKKA